MRRRVDRLTNPALNTESSKAERGGDQVAAQAPSTLNEPNEMKQVNALYSLLENRYASTYPIPERMRYPESNKTHYEDLLRELEEAPERSKLTSFMQRLKGRFRLS